MKLSFTGDRPFLFALFDSDGGGSGGSGGSGYSDYGDADAGTGKGTGLAAGYSQAAASLGAAGVSGIGTGGKGSTSGKSTSGGGFGTSNYGDDTSGRSSSSASNGIGAGFGSSDYGDAGGFAGFGSDSPGYGVGGVGTGLGAGYAEAASSMGQAGVSGLGDLGPGFGAFGVGTNPTAGYQMAAVTTDVADIGSIGGRSRGRQAIADALSSFYSTVIGAESRADRYNSLNYAVPSTFAAPNDLTSMTIGQIKSLQADMLAAQRGRPSDEKSTAIGAFQTKASTLDFAQSLTDMPDDALFDEENQQTLALALAQHRANKSLNSNGEIDVDAFANQLANEWAGFENSTGKSAHHGVGKNKSNTSFSAVKSVAQAMVNSGAVTPNGKVSYAAPPSSVAQAVAQQNAAQASYASAAGRTPSSAQVGPTSTASAPVGSFSSPAAMAAAQRSAENQSMADLAAMEAVKSSISQPTGLSVAQAVAQQEQARSTAEYDDEAVAYNDAYWSRENTRNPVSPELSGEDAPETAAEPDNVASTPKSFEETYLGKPAEVGDSKDGQVEDEGKSSIGSKIGATAIDVALGMIPGVGTAISIGNLGAKAVTGKSLGERAIDFVGSLEGPSNGIGALSMAGDGGISLLPEHAAKKQPEAKPAEPEKVNDFGIKYLGWRSSTKRPTPKEKWGDRTGYGRREYAA